MLENNFLFPRCNYVPMSTIMSNSVWLDRTLVGEIYGNHWHGHRSYAVAITKSPYWHVEQGDPHGATVRSLRRSKRITTPDARKSGKSYSGKEDQPWEKPTIVRPSWTGKTSIQASRLEAQPNPKPYIFQQSTRVVQWSDITGWSNGGL